MSTEQCVRFQEVLDYASDEAPLQAFLAKHPQMLAAVLLTGHTRVVRSQVRLGSEFVADFAVADVSSIGVRWTLIEIESPRAQAIKQDGEYADRVRHALHQVDEWRNWIRANQAYAAALHGGPRLIGVEHPAGLVVAGRRDAYDSEPSWLRAGTLAERRCEVHSYDWLLDQFRAETRRR